MDQRVYTEQRSESLLQAASALIEPNRVTQGLVKMTRLRDLPMAAPSARREDWWGYVKQAYVFICL